MFRIVKKSIYWFISSGLLMVLSVIALSVFGLRLGIDYKGGSVIEFSSKNNDKAVIAENVLKEQSITSFQIKLNNNDLATIKTPELTASQHVALSQAMKEKISDYTEISYDSVGPVVSRDLINKSVWAIILASVGIIFYIAYAFRKVPKPLSSWKLGTSAVIALIHDLLITTGFISIISHYVTWVEVDALFVTALLTIMGFSVHDTIVVYDRLRENFIKNPHQDIQETVEESVNQTLARSINTSVTVIIVLIALYLLGGASIRHFVLTLIVGIFFGTYSSIFVATAIVVSWHKKRRQPAQ